MIKKFSLCMIMALLLLSVASAHPGRTDGRGGHYNSATGEYHYHHGYRAHQHTDLDGDGKADCPYNFDDQTGARSGTSSSKTTSVTTSSVQTPAKETQKVTFWEILPSLAIGLFPFWVPAVIFVVSKVRAPFRRKKERLATLNQCMRDLNNILPTDQNKEEYDSLRLARPAMCEELRAQYDVLCGRKRLYDGLVPICTNYLKTYITDLTVRTRKFQREHRAEYFTAIGRATGIPNGCYVGEDGLPHSTIYDIYTFYSSNQNIYHSSGCRYANVAHPVNAATVEKYRMRPCRVCDPHFDITWYYAYMDFTSKHSSLDEIIRADIRGSEHYWWEVVS